MSKACERAGCSNTFEPPANNPHQKYCSTYCRQKAKRVRYAHTLVDRVCPTCGQTYQTTELDLREGRKNYCSDDCRQPVRHKAVEVTCQRCRIQFMAYPQTKWCEECRKAIAREKQYYRAKSNHVRVERVCAQCSNVFVAHYGSKLRVYCSHRCRQKAMAQHKKNHERVEYYRRRNKWMRKPPGAARVYRARIFERDNWTCQLCGRKVDKRLKWPHPKSATIDHILPLANGGQHVPENCQLAHFICNSRRSNNGEAQLRLFA